MSLDFGNSDDLEVFDYDVQSPPSELPSELFEDEMALICTRTRDIADVRSHQRLLLGTLYARGQDHSHPLVRAALPLNIDVLETVLMYLAASRAFPGHNKLADLHATRPQKRARFQGH